MQNINIIKNKNRFFAVSLIIIAIGIVFYFINGVQLDIQFSGGTRILIETNEPIDINKAGSMVEEAIGKAVTPQMLETYNPNDNSKAIYMLRLDIAGNEALTDEERDNVIDLITENFNVKENGNQEMLSVEASIGRETLMNGLKAMIVASVLIILYVTWRFSALHGFSAAITALVALFHDILIVFALYTVFRIPLNEVFITAILTIIGYSLNDTIVVYDRIRENSKLMRKYSLEEIVNTSILQSMNRTINTTVTTLLVVIPLYIFATINNIPSLINFSLPLMIGFIAGTYSSLFIASPLWMMWRKSAARKALKSA